MTPEDAIKILNQYIHEPECVSLEDEAHAIKLGIEALKRLQANRQDPEFDHWVPLPGETEE